MLELLFQGFIEWIYGLILECWEYFASVLFDLMSLDFAYLREHIPIIDTIRQIMLGVGWALLIGFVDGLGAGLGITLLGVSVLGYVGYVFLLPYMDLSYSLYYRQLTAVPASGAGDEWTPEL